MAPDAQFEIRQYANAIACIVEQLFPMSWRAFDIYRRESVTLDGAERGVLARIIRNLGVQDDIDKLVSDALESPWDNQWFADGSRNRRELIEALTKLGFGDSNSSNEE